MGLACEGGRTRSVVMPSDVPFAYSIQPEPHRERGAAILSAHPELRRLAGPEPLTGLVIIASVGLQTAIALKLALLPWWAILLAAYTVGAVLNLGCWALIHEGSHNLIGRSARVNKLWSIAANLPILVPAAATFRVFHLHHHRHQGDPRWDMDMPLAEEVRLVGASPLRKAVWLALFMPLQVVRATKAPHIRIMGAWPWLNIGACTVYAGVLFAARGPAPVAYLLLSSWFAMGLHPLGARWVQEHFTLRPGQETNSYYGPANRLVFNCGYHNEHHDLPGIAWMHLPAVRRTAREFYDPLFSVHSWTALLWHFLTSRELSLDCRIARNDGLAKSSLADASELRKAA